MNIQTKPNNTNLNPDKFSINQRQDLFTIMHGPRIKYSFNSIIKEST